MKNVRHKIGELFYDTLGIGVLSAISAMIALTVVGILLLPVIWIAAGLYGFLMNAKNRTWKNGIISAILGPFQVYWFMPDIFEQIDENAEIDKLLKIEIKKLNEKH